MAVKLMLYSEPERGGEGGLGGMVLGQVLLSAKLFTHCLSGWGKQPSLGGASPVSKKHFIGWGQDRDTGVIRSSAIRET